MTRLLLSILASVALLLGAAPTTRAQLLDTTLTLGKSPDAVVLPLAIATSGSYKLTIGDLGGASGPARLARLDVAVMSGSTLVTSLGVLPADADGVATKTFTASAGEHRVVIVGQPGAGATVGSGTLRIEDSAGGRVLLDDVRSFTVEAPPTDSPATFEHELQVAAGGSYVLETTDFALPQPFATLRTTVIRRSDGTVLADVTGPAQIALAVAGADVYETFVYAELAPDVGQGLVGIRLRDTGTGAITFSTVHELGEWPFKHAFDLTGPTTLELALTDLAFPLPLASVGAVLVHRGGLAAPPLAAPGVVTAGATAGPYVAYAASQPAAASTGSFGLRVSDAAGGRRVEAVHNVTTPQPETDAGTVDAGFDLVTPGEYTLTLTDFGAAGFFDAFTSIELALTRDNAIVDTLNATGSFTFAGTPGHYSLAVLADPAGDAGAGLMGIEVRGAGAVDPVYTNTAAIGGSFISATFDVTTEQSVDTTLTDVVFPARFAEVKLAVTRGAARAGEIVGAGTFSFIAKPGTYFVNMLAKPDAQIGYGTLGIRVRATPPTPALTLAASSNRVQAGNSVTLTWSSTGTAGCTASDGWTGARDTSGSASIGPLLVDTKFKLTCSGEGGNRDASVDVTIVPEERGSTGGGGAVDAVLLALLAFASAGVRLRRRAAGR